MGAASTARVATSRLCVCPDHCHTHSERRFCTCSASIYCLMRALRAGARHIGMGAVSVRKLCVCHTVRAYAQAASPTTTEPNFGQGPRSSSFSTKEGEIHTGVTLGPARLACSSSGRPNTSLLPTYTAHYPAKLRRLCWVIGCVLITEAASVSGDAPDEDASFGRSPLA